MEEIRTRARLVDPAASSLFTHGLSTLVPRAEIEEVLQRGEYPAPLFLDISRVDGGHDDDVTAHARVMVDWDEPTLQELLRTTSDSEIRLSFDADELERALDESEVDAHGMREKLAVVAVAVAAAGASAGIASAGIPGPGMMADQGNTPATAPASTAVPGNDANPLSRYVASVDAGQATAAAPDALSRYVANTGNDAAAAAPDALSRYVANTGNDASAAAPDALSRYVANTGNDASAAAPDALSRYVANTGNDVSAAAPDALSRYVANTGNDTAVNAPSATAPDAAGSGSSISLPSPAEGAGLAAGLALLITGAGFVAVRSRRPPELPA